MVASTIIFLMLFHYYVSSNFNPILSKMVDWKFVCVLIIYLLSYVILPVWEYELHMLFIALNKKIKTV